jgi:hypothetical protein
VSSPRLWHTVAVSCDPYYGLDPVPFEGLTRGDTYAFPFLSEETTDDEITEATVWTPRDLSGGTFAVTVRVGSEDGDEWADASITVDDTGAASGAYTVELSDTTSAVPGYQYFFDVEYTEGTSIETLVKGYFTFEADVTRA